MKKHNEMTIVQREVSARKEVALKQYEDSMRRLKEGKFPVREGSIVLRVVNGIKIGESSADIHMGDVIENVYATPHPRSIRATLQANDESQYYYDKQPFDPYQRVALIKVKSFMIPNPDITHDPVGDKDQVVVTGDVIAILTPSEFERKYKDVDNVADFDT